MTRAPTTMRQVLLCPRAEHRRVFVVRADGDHRRAGRSCSELNAMLMLMSLRLWKPRRGRGWNFGERLRLKVAR